MKKPFSLNLIFWHLFLHSSKACPTFFFFLIVRDLQTSLMRKLSSVPGSTYNVVCALQRKRLMSSSEKKVVERELMNVGSNLQLFHLWTSSYFFQHYYFQVSSFWKALHIKITKQKGHINASSLKVRTEMTNERSTCSILPLPTSQKWDHIPSTHQLSLLCHSTNTNSFQRKNKGLNWGGRGSTTIFP